MSSRLKILSTLAGSGFHGRESALLHSDAAPRETRVKGNFVPDKMLRRWYFTRTGSALVNATERMCVFTTPKLELSLLAPSGSWMFRVASPLNAARRDFFFCNYAHFVVDALEITR